MLEGEAPISQSSFISKLGLTGPNLPCAETVERKNIIKTEVSTMVLGQHFSIFVVTILENEEIEFKINVFLNE